MGYFGCHLSASSGNLAMVQTALDIGANTFAFFTRNPRGSYGKPVDPEDCALAIKALEDQSFGKLVAHGSYTMNLATFSEENRAFAKEILLDDLYRMSFLPGQYYNFHPGAHVGQGEAAGIEYISQALCEGLEKKYPVTVLLETMSGKGSEIGGTFEQMKAIIDAVDSPMLGVCLDTCHVWDAGYDIVNSLDSVLEEFDRIVGIDRLKALHLNDSKNPLGSHKDRHACIGEGYLGISAFSNIVRHPVLKNLPMILETPNELPGYQKEIALLRQLEQ